MAAKTVRWVGTLALVWTTESGAVTLGERTMYKQVWEGPYSSCKAGAINAHRGYFGSGIDGWGMLGWVVASSDVTPFKGCRARLTISWEPGGASAYMPLPCDDCNIEPQELYPLVERHHYFNQTSTGTGSMPDITLETIMLVQLATHGPTYSCRLDAQQNILDLEDSDQSTLGWALLQMWRKGEQTFYLAGQKYTWTYYSYMLPSITLGGFAETPYGPGSVPSSFSSDLSWLRLADAMAPVGVNGSMWKVTRTWLGGPKGHWDPILYPS